MNLIRFNNLVQSVIVSSFNLLKAILNSLQGVTDDENESLQFEDWTSEDKEKLLQLKAKVRFCLQVFL